MNLIELHKKIVELLWEYTKENWQSTESVTFTIDGLNESIKYNDKGVSTDSSLIFRNINGDIIVESF